MADFKIPLAQCCHRPPDTVVQGDDFVFRCPSCGRSVAICPAEKVRIRPQGNFIAPAWAVEAAVVKWNTKEKTNGR